VALLLTPFGEVDTPAQSLLLRLLGALTLMAPSPRIAATTSSSSDVISAVTATQASWDCGTCMAMSRSAFLGYGPHVWGVVLGPQHPNLSGKLLQVEKRKCRCGRLACWVEFQHFGQHH
jgi:hypothetical protein